MPRPSLSALLPFFVATLATGCNARSAKSTGDAGPSHPALPSPAQNAAGRPGHDAGTQREVDASLPARGPSDDDASSGGGTPGPDAPRLDDFDAGPTSAVTWGGASSTEDASAGTSGAGGHGSEDPASRGGSPNDGGRGGSAGSTGTPPLSSPPLAFTDVGPTSGIEPYRMADGPRAGIAAEDYDGDGFIDVFVPTGSGVPNRLYRNLGDGTFVDVAPSLGLASVEKHRTALWFDSDGDQDLDLVIASDCRALHIGDGVPCPTEPNLWLYQQGDDGTFQDVTEQAGLSVAWGGADNQHRAGMAAGDYDGDGDLDLVVPGWKMQPFLFRNDGGSFSDVTSEAGLPVEANWYQRAVFHDFDRDGWLDLYFAIDIFEPNTLFLNQKDGTFRDVAVSAGVANASTDMGVAIGDYDNDGDFDFYVTVITQNEYSNQLYRNDSEAGTLTFTNAALDLAVAYAGWGWGVTFFDADADGWLDLATTNGSHLGPNFRADRSRFWLNPGREGQPWPDLSGLVGFNDAAVASGLISFDYDRDGDLDLLQATNDGGPLRLLRNDRQGDAAQHHTLIVRPRQPGPNHWAIGATVEVRLGEVRMIRPIHAGISTDSQEPAEAHFGLGTATSVDEVAVTWPDGTRTAVSDVEVDQVLDVTP